MFLQWKDAIESQNSRVISFGSRNDHYLVAGKVVSKVDSIKEKSRLHLSGLKNLTKKEKCGIQVMIDSIANFQPLIIAWHSFLLGSKTGLKIWRRGPSRPTYNVFNDLTSS